MFFGLWVSLSKGYECLLFYVSNLRSRFRVIRFPFSTTPHSNSLVKSEMGVYSVRR